jgi:hypothetical protein
MNILKKINIEKNLFAFNIKYHILRSSQVTGLLKRIPDKIIIL